jgi:DNA-binding MarR family transcriptional regulator
MRAAPALTALHRRRLRELWRSAGWPCHDMLEVELLVAGLVERLRDAQGRETLRVTDAGVALIAESLQANRARRSAHETLVERVAREMTRAGRIAWRGLALRAKVGEAWAIAMPDVYSIRNTTVEDYLEPVVHEIKVHRADLLADLKREAKRAAYLQLGGECWYVIREGIARADEIPPECGVMVATDSLLDVARPAPRRALRLPFSAWMVLARATPIDGWRADEAQRWLGDESLDDDRAATAG